MVDVAVGVMLLAALFVMTMGAHVFARAWFGEVGGFYIWYAVSVGLACVYIGWRNRK